MNTQKFPLINQYLFGRHYHFTGRNWRQTFPVKRKTEYGENRQFCPVCNSMPVSSMVQIGTTQGLRYLHCNLCETEWHVVRIKMY